MYLKYFILWVESQIPDLFNWVFLIKILLGYVFFKNSFKFLYSFLKIENRLRFLYLFSNKFLLIFLIQYLKKLKGKRLNIGKLILIN